MKMSYRLETWIIDYNCMTQPNDTQRKMASHVKCVLVGDNNVGKTTLVFKYVNGEVPIPDWLPSIYNDWAVERTIEGERAIVSLWDTVGSEEPQMERLRPLGYPEASIFLFCFSLVDPVSFENIKTRWLPEVIAVCPNTPIILVGTKLDLRDDPCTVQRLQESSVSQITYKKGLEMMKDINALKYYECSAITHHRIELIDEAFKCAILCKKQSRNSRKCVAF